MHTIHPYLVKNTQFPKTLKTSKTSKCSRMSKIAIVSTSPDDKIISHRRERWLYILNLLPEPHVTKMRADVSEVTLGRADQ